MSRTLLVLGVCVAVALGGCGGSSDTSTTSSTSETTPISTTAQAEAKSAAAGDVKGSEHSPSKSNSKPKSSQPQQANGDSPKHLKLVRVPLISSRPVAGSKHPAPEVKTVKGGDNSVQEYGVEADESERREAAIALQAFLNARAEEDWGSACALLAKKPMEQFEKMQKAAAAQGEDLNSCAKTMALLKESEASLIEQAKITEVLSFRGGGDLAGDPSYLIFTAPPSNTLYSMPMYLQGGAWKVGLARAAELPVG